MSVTPGARLGPYEILSALGAGGMGEVYRARDTKLNRDVAIKVLPEAFAQDADRLTRFTREAQTLAALNHPNIAAIYGIEQNALVMELVEGDDLSTLIARGLMPLVDALPITRQIAEALEAAHEAGIIHRDLKPANIKVRADGTVKVLDFGLAKAIDPQGASGTMDPSNSPTLTGHATQLGMILGTAAYMAPEQARGKAVDRRADIWAFGVVVYEMLTGTRMFAAGEVSDVLAAVLRQDIDWTALPAQTPMRLRRLLERCLDRDPRSRLRDIGEARVEIAKIESGAPDSVSGMMPVVESRGATWRRALPWAATTVAIVAATVIGVVAFRRPAATATPMWTSIAAPVDRFSPGSAPVLSPDGQQIAFTARDASGKDHIWVRALDAQATRVVPATEGAQSPFWSPDGQSMGFFKNQKLHIVSIAGGTSRVLANIVASFPRGATWGRDGVFLFVPGPTLGIYRVPASGGTAVSVGSSSDAGASFSMFPSFLPDGRHFLYTSFREREWWINVGSLDATTTTPLLKAFSNAEYANGHLLFGSKGALYAQAFDVAALALSGERIRVIDSVGKGPGHAANYAFSSAHGVIAAGNALACQESQPIWLDEKGMPGRALGEAGPICGLSVTRDRTKAVIVRSDPALNSFDPWIVKLDSGFASAVRTGAEGSGAVSPVWSADGSRIFFRDDTGLRSLSPSGGADTHWPMQIHWPSSSSPDGKFLLIMTQSADTLNDLMLVGLTGDHTPVPYLQTSFNESGGRFSPDGRSVAYVSDASNRQEVYVQSFPAAGEKSRISANGGNNPQWSDDGTSVYFLSQESGGKTIMMVGQIRPGGAAPRRVFQMPAGYSGGYTVFDNGRRFLINVLVPDTAPQVITIGLNWAAALGNGR